MSASPITRFQFRACARDLGDERADHGPWVEGVSPAADLAHEMCFDITPPYDEIYVERRTVGEPHRHLTIRQA